jgi:hypothetical protein
MYVLKTYAIAGAKYSGDVVPMVERFDCALKMTNALFEYHLEAFVPTRVHHFRALLDAEPFDQ